MGNSGHRSRPVGNQMPFYSMCTSQFSVCLSFCSVRLSLPSLPKILFLILWKHNMGKHCFQVVTFGLSPGVFSVLFCLVRLKHLRTRPFCKSKKSQWLHPCLFVCAAIAQEKTETELRDRIGAFDKSNLKHTKTEEKTVLPNRDGELGLILSCVRNWKKRLSCLGWWGSNLGLIQSCVRSWKKRLSCLGW